MTVAVLRARRRGTTAVLLAVALGAACGGSAHPGPNEPGPVAQVLVSPTLDTLFVGTGRQLAAVPVDSGGVPVTSASVVWVSGNPAVATITPAGQVAAVAPGSAQMTATADGKAGFATIVVKVPPAGAVTVAPGVDSVAAGSVVQFTATVWNGSGQPVPEAPITWSSLTPGVATVTPSGLVTGVAIGTATIRAISGADTGTAQVKVRSAFTRLDGALQPLSDLAGGSYLGFAGGLYPGSSTLPAGHRAGGLPLAQAVVPRDTTGAPAAGGSWVLMSIGMSNTTQEWCATLYDDPCTSWSFTGQASADPAVRHTGLRIVNGAKGKQSATTWLNTSDVNYIRIRDSVLTPLGLSEKQVQVIWLKVVDEFPATSLPSASADAFVLLGRLGQIVRTLKSRYPNLQLVFLSSRTYGGYSLGLINPEPYAFESGLAVKWLVAAQMAQMASGGGAVDARAGNLNYTTGVAPWVGWGPYLWAHGSTPRQDGYSWPAGDSEPDGVHPSQAGETKVGSALLSFFKASPLAKCWFLVSGTCS